MSKASKGTFTGYFIPASIIGIQKLTWLDRLLLCEIHCHSVITWCELSDSYLACLFDTSKPKIRKSLTNLENEKLIRILVENGSRFLRANSRDF